VENWAYYRRRHANSFEQGAGFRVPRTAVAWAAGFLLRPVENAGARWRRSPMGAVRADSRRRRRSPHGTRIRPEPSVRCLRSPTVIAHPHAGGRGDGPRGRRAPELADGIRLCEAPAMPLRWGLRRCEVAARTMTHVQQRLAVGLTEDWRQRARMWVQAGFPSEQDQQLHRRVYHRFARVGKLLPWKE